MRLRLQWASVLDRWDARLRRLGERLGYPQPWLQEFNTYLEDRMTLEEFWVRYTLKRLDVQPWLQKITTEEDALAFYRESDYLLWRNLVHRRHSAWRRVLVTMRGKKGQLVEYGCGIAPVSAWLHRRTAWSFWLIDFTGPAREFAHTRLAKWSHWSDTPQWEYWKTQIRWPFARVVTALDVLEHTADPVYTVMRLERALVPGGYLHWNFIEASETSEGLNLATAAQRQETLDYLYTHLRLIWSSPDHLVSQKP